MTWDLQQLFRLHSGEIIRSLRRRGFSPDTAADLTQEAFLRALLIPPGQGGPRYNPKAYLYTIARNLGLSQKRRERAVPMLPLTDEHSQLLADTAPLAERVVYSRQLLAQVEQALASLPERTRHAYRMHRVEGRKLAEIAAELEISIPRTWTLIKGAYQHLLNEVDPD